MSAEKTFLASLHHAEELFAQQAYAEAIPIYRQLLDNPGNNKPTILEHLAQSCYALHQYKEALRYFNWLATTRPLSLQESLLQGECALKTQEYAQAKAIFHTITESSRSPLSFQGLIRASLFLGEDISPLIEAYLQLPSLQPSDILTLTDYILPLFPQQAEYLLSKAQEIFQQNHEILKWLAHCALQKNERQKALSLYRQILLKAPNKFPEAILFVIKEAIAKKALNEAEQLIMSAITQGLFSETIIGELVQLYRKHSPQKAISILMTAIKQNPTHSSLFFPLIELLAREKNTEQLYTIAKQAYEQTGEPLPLKIAGSYAITVGDHQNACTFLTQVFEQTHDKESLELLLVSLFSLHNYQTILQLATSIDANTRYEATTYYIIAQAYYNLNQPKEAKQWAERGKSLYPNDPNLLYALGIAQLANHNPQSALLPLTHALKIIRDPEILLSLGICHFELQNTDEAMKLFLEYCDKKQNPQTCSNLATITLSKGYPELAKLLVKKALQIDPRYPLTPTLKELL